MRTYEQTRAEVIRHRMGIILAMVQLAESETPPNDAPDPGDGYLRLAAEEARRMVFLEMSEGYVRDPQEDFVRALRQFRGAFDRATGIGGILRDYVEEDLRLGLEEFVEKTLKEAR